MIRTLIMSVCLATVSTVAAQVRVVTIEGAGTDGQWSGVGPAGEVMLIHDGQATPFAPDKLMLIRWKNASTKPATAPSTAPAQGMTVFLVDGNRLQGRITGGDSKTMTLATELIPEIKLPLARLAGIRFMSGEPAEAATAFSTALAGRDPSQDTLIVVRDGRVTVLKGVTESLGADGGSFRWRDRSVPLNPQSTYGLVFAAGVQSSSAAQATCVLRDGSRWAGKLVGGDSHSVTIEMAEGVKVALPVAQVSEIRFRSDRVVFVSDLEPAEFVMEPFATTRWPYRRDRSVANRPMQIGEQSFDRGIGVHSRSVLTYNLAAPFSKLAAVIGIDAGAAPLGNVVFRVTADDKEVFNSGPLTGRDQPRSINVSIAGAKRLGLIVEFGEELDIGDQADWGNLRLIK